MAILTILILPIQEHGYLSIPLYHPQFLSYHIISHIYFIYYVVFYNLVFYFLICHGLRLEYPKPDVFFLHFSLNHLDILFYEYYSRVHRCSYSFIFFEICTLWQYKISFFALLNTFWPESNFCITFRLWFFKKNLGRKKFSSTLLGSSGCSKN